MYYQTDYLAHHGIKGQKWHVRRYQNEDGTLTPEGREHYDVGEPEGNGSGKKKANSAETAKKAKKYSRLKKIGIGLAAAAATAAVGYGVHKSTKLRDQMRDMAKQESADHDYDKRVDSMKARMMLRSAKDRRANPEKLSPKQNINDYANELRYKENMRSAHEYFKQAKHHADMAKKYSDIAKTTTRTKAAMNYIKNRGRIVI